MTQQPASENEQEPMTSSHGHDPEEFDPEEEPVGTLALLTIYIIVVIGLWVAVYVTLIERS